MKYEPACGADQRTVEGALIGHMCLPPKSGGGNILIYTGRKKIEKYEGGHLTLDKRGRKQRREHQTLIHQALMLTGRESLIRLIGKRRRTLSSNPSLFHIQTQRAPSTPQKESHGKSSSSDTRKEEDSTDERAGTSGGHLYDNLDWVTCPACGNNVRATDYTVNSHLDACPTRGKKRRLTQRTLLQFSFCSRPNDRAFLIEANNVEDTMKQMSSNENSGPSTVAKLPKLGCAENFGMKERKLDLICSAQSIVETRGDVSVEDLNKDENDIVDCNEVDLLSPCASSCDVKMPKLDIAGATLETYIVGRRFANEVELKQGVSISLLRDSENVKDPNAIKVVQTDSRFHQMLGYLPRALAKYLSPLIDKYCLEFEVC